ncbi:MAG TPA: hypothetical protein VG713_07490 [Pirellulales bacterium]|nr:hypothetical protein [Pirellulales bacterium]
MPAQQSEAIARLKAQLRELETLARSSDAPRFSTGFPSLDRLLPGQGLTPGTLVEWLEDAPGSGAGTLAVKAAVQASHAGGAVVVIDGRGEFYPPGATCLGLDLRGVLLVRPTKIRDELWAIDQALRSGAVAAVLAWPLRADERAMRRWQLAAEQCTTLGLFVRPTSVRDEPCWAELRLRVATVPIELPVGEIASSVPRRLRVELLRARGDFAHRCIDLELRHETSDVHRAVTTTQGRKHRPAPRRHAG